MRSSLRFPKDPNLLGGGGPESPPFLGLTAPSATRGTCWRWAARAAMGGRRVLVSHGDAFRQERGVRSSSGPFTTQLRCGVREEPEEGRSGLVGCVRWLRGSRGRCTCVCVCAGRAEPPAAAGMLSGAAFGFVRILNGEGRRGAQGAKRGGGGRRRSRRGRVCIWKRAFYECVRIEINRKGPIQALTSRKRGAAFHPRLNCFRLCRPAGRFGLWGLAGSPPPPPRDAALPHMRGSVWASAALPSVTGTVLQSRTATRAGKWRRKRLLCLSKKHAAMLWNGRRWVMALENPIRPNAGVPAPRRTAGNETRRPAPRSPAPWAPWPDGPDSSPCIQCQRRTRRKSPLRKGAVGAGKQSSLGGVVTAVNLLALPGSGLSCAAGAVFRHFQAVLLRLWVFSMRMGALLELGSKPPVLLLLGDGGGVVLFGVLFGCVFFFPFPG